MTACVDNKEKKGGAAKAVSATLAGVLAVGMVPAVAFATEGEAQEQGEDVSLLDMTLSQAVNAGKIAAFQSGEAGDTFVANGKPQGLVPTKVQPFSTETAESQLDVLHYYVYKQVPATTAGAQNDSGYKLNGKDFYFDPTGMEGGEYLTDKLPTDPGSYIVVATADVDGTETPVLEGVAFSITAAEFAGAEFYEVDGEDATDLSDTEFVFDNAVWSVGKAAGNLGIMIDGEAIDVDDVTVTWYNDDNSPVTGGEPKAAGDYIAVVSGTDGAFAGKQGKIELTIDPYDLKGANIVIDAKERDAEDASNPAFGSITIDGKNLAVESPYADYINYTTTLPLETGEATVTFTVDEEALKDNDLEGSVIGATTATYDIVDHVLSTTTVTYDGKRFMSYTEGAPLKVDFSATPTNAFDATKVAFKYDDPMTGEEVTTTDYTLRVVNTETNAVGGVEMLTQSGTYTVTAILDSAALDYAVAGKSSDMYVEVTQGDISSADVAFTYKDEIVIDGEIDASYIPGVNLADDIAATVKTTTGVLVPESAYTLEVTKKQTDNTYAVVDAITDAGDYKVTVKAPGYDLTGDYVLDLTVDKRELNTAAVEIRVKDEFRYTNAQGVEQSFVIYTGQEITPSFEWGIVENGKVTTWYDLPAADYTVVYKVKGVETELKDIDDYVANITANANSVNYMTTGGAATADVKISDAKVFADVPATHWSAPYVYQATDLKYMKGYSGTKIFGPDAAITRADAIIVLYNMAGGEVYNGEEDLENTVHDFEGYVANFTDIDKNAYYMAALSWAQKIGLANGDEGQGTFRPNDSISRQEFVTLLYRYAGMTGADTTIADKAAELAKYPDGETVADWASDAVAWASQNAIMNGYTDAGGYMMPGLDVSRGQVAKMGVQLQPKAIETLFVTE